MLEKVVIEIEDQTEAEAMAEQIPKLELAGLQVEYYDKNPMSGTGGEAVLFVTDNPDNVWKKYGTDCCIVLYLTEANSEKWWKGISYAVLSVRGLEPDFLEKVYRRYAGAPWDILETERLLIREMTEENLDDLYRIHNQPGIEDFVAPLETDREKQREILKSYIRKVYPIFGFGMWMVVEKESGRCIGRVGLQMESSIRTSCRDDEVRMSEQVPELGFIMEISEQHKGYCQEACHAVLQYGFEELEMDKICAVVAENNIASAKLCFRLGGRAQKKDGQYLFYWSKMKPELFDEDEKGKNDFEYTSR